MLEIRVAEIRDIPKIIKCHERNFEPYLSATQLKSHMGEFPHLAFVLESKTKEIHGYILGEMRIKKKQEYGVLTSLAVNKRFREKGYGKKLCNSLFNAMIQTYKANTVTVYIRLTNELAVQFYENLDFENEGVEAEYFSDQTDAYVLKYNLTNFVITEGVAN
ncbi:N-terminal acetyltransferase A complex catalytic subunit ard1-like [Photinus pyralis]|uniref:N-terminal acetyltransferase A complex catalytic subunit ard1-like n=1 Tax=Photinus pyralis TaxID=7054 RepID=UPI00126777E2|nr:N-terminal acetyltransferase A complex catalytic subunit ard1-like [Photinus pyralis]